jgi:hypothetical protein
MAPRAAAVWSERLAFYPDSRYLCEYRRPDDPRAAAHKTLFSGCLSDPPPERRRRALDDEYRRLIGPNDSAVLSVEPERHRENRSSRWPPPQDEPVIDCGEPELISFLAWRSMFFEGLLGLLPAMPYRPTAY